MKSIKSTEIYTSSIPFPKLMISEDGLIVLFTKPGLGIVLHEGGLNSFGEYDNRWGMNYFRDYDGTLTLSN